MRSWINSLLSRFRRGRWKVIGADWTVLGVMWILPLCLFLQQEFQCHALRCTPVEALSSVTRSGNGSLKPATLSECFNPLTTTLSGWQVGSCGQVTAHLLLPSSSSPQPARVSFCLLPHPASGPLSCSFRQGPEQTATSAANLYGELPRLRRPF